MALVDQFGAISSDGVRRGQIRVAARARGREELFLTLVLAVGGLVDLFHLIKPGGVSALAILTVIYAAVSWSLWLAQPRDPRHVSPAIKPFLLFLGWVVLSFIWHRPTILGMQNVLVWFTFAGLFMLSENTVVRYALATDWVSKTLVGATLLACVLYVVFMLFDGLGSNLVFHARTFATFVLIGMSWFLAGWRYGSKADLFKALLIVVLIVLSLSRMALATAFLLFPLTWIGGLRKRDWLRLALVGLVISAALYVAVSNFKPLHDRFALDSDVMSLTGDDATDYTSGRFTYWVITLDSALEAPVIGHGAGSSASLLSELWETESPLDEPLRIFHDYGLIGLVLVLVALRKFVQVSRRKWIEAERSGSPQAKFHLASFLAIVAVCFPMITENSFAYLFMMAPLAVVVGAALGSSRAAYG